MKRQPACYQRSLPAILATAFVILTGAGCSTAPHLTGIVHEGPQGTVYLEEIPDLYFEAHHPASLSTPAAARLLEGVQVQQADQDMAGSWPRFWRRPCRGHAPNSTSHSDRCIPTAPTLA